MLFLKVFLIVVVLPLTAGALLALVLRETYIRHPLPLGGTIGPRKKKTAAVEKQGSTGESALLPGDEASDTESVTLRLISQALLTPDSSAVESSADEPSVEENTPLPSEISVFDGTENIPDNIPISSVLESMTSEASVTLPGDFENIIEEVSQSGIIMPESIRDDLDHEDLLALADALPGAKIDFAQELEKDPEQSDAISPMGKELIGENFDFDALEKQAIQAKEALQTRQSFELDVQEDESGTIQVSSPFIFDAAPQLADFTMPQTILPMFSDDWIQESSSTAESAEEDATKFCFTEESRPMFVRKKKQSEPVA